MLSVWVDDGHQLELTKHGNGHLLVRCIHFWCASKALTAVGVNVVHPVWVDDGNQLELAMHGNAFCLLGAYTFGAHQRH